jgi:hypothetical protein
MEVKTMTNTKDEVYVVSSETNEVKPENRDELKLATGDELDAIIRDSEAEVLGIFGNDKTTDPSYKECKRCQKNGRVGIYPLDQFSVKQDGKRHSQCKVCRTEQANEWVAKQGEKRKEYQKEYRRKNKERLAIYAQARAYDAKRAAEQPVEETVETETKREDVLFIMAGEENV